MVITMKYKKSLEINMIKYTNTVEETMELGFKLGKVCPKNKVLCLTGDLGTGKTHFTKGFAKGLGIEATITSPTFTLIHEYQEGRLPFYHFDVYRVNDLEEVLDLGFDEYIYGEGITLIEWADLIEPLLPDDFIQIKIEKVEGNLTKRKITFNPFGKSATFLEEIQ